MDDELDEEERDHGLRRTTTTLRPDEYAHMSYQNDRTTRRDGQYDQRSDGNPVVEAMQLPFEQAAAFQRATAGMVLGGLELVESTQRAGADLTRSMVRSYRDAIEETTDAQGRGRRQYASQRAPPQQPRQQQPRQHAQPRQPPAELSTQRLQRQSAGDPEAKYQAQGRQYEQEPARQREQERPRQSTEPAEIQQTGPAGQPRQQPSQ